MSSLHNNLQPAAVEQQIAKWFESPRWSKTTRPYSAKDVARFRGTVPQVYPSHVMAQKLYGLLEASFNQRSFQLAYGALDPIQVINLSKYLKTVYVSGWQCSSTASVTNEPGPDFADYPSQTVPNKVDQLFKAQLHHDRRQAEELSHLAPAERAASKAHDYMAPIIADADAGFGGPTSVMKLTKLFVQAGAAGIHIEDQRAGTKKCGHLGGKILVPCREMVTRLIMARLQADVCGSDLVIIARTDAEAATHIDNNIDPVDQAFILGVTDPFGGPNSKLMTFPEAGKEMLLTSMMEPANRDKLLEEWSTLAYSAGLKKAKEFARKNGFDFYFDWDTPRTHEGYYPIRHSVDMCVNRSKEYAKYCDMVWMETSKPSIKVAEEFSTKLRRHTPDVWLAYNLSPSFNWDAAGMKEEEMKSFCTDLGRLGYAWQFITLAGFHMNSLISEEFSKAYSQKHIFGYIESIQRRERASNVDQLKHQKWSGAEYIDHMITTADLNNSSIAMKNSTEKQFSSEVAIKPIHEASPQKRKVKAQPRAML